jgi:hypothetical protein
VEDFGALAFEPRAFACGHDGDGEVWGGHRPLWSHVGFGRTSEAASGEPGEMDFPSGLS